jgi:hypothetical protein
MQFSPVAYHFHPLRGKYLFTTLFSNISHSYLSQSNHISHPYRATGKIIVLYSSAFTFFGRERGQEVLKWIVIYISQIYSALLYSCSYLIPQAKPVILL